MYPIGYSRGFPGLTYVENDPDFSPITPNSFLKFDSGRSMVIADEVIDCPDRNELMKSLSKIQELKECFKARWYEEYLLSLRELSKDQHQDSWKDRVKVGDIVLIDSPAKPRPYWALGRVIELLPGNDDRTRTVKVIRSDRSEGVYALKLLYPLEISVSSCRDEVPEVPQESLEQQPQDVGRSRPRRLAAAKCLQFMRDLSN